MVLSFAADIPPGSPRPLLPWRVEAISGHRLLSQTNECGREMQNRLVLGVLSTHTQGLKLGEGSFNTNKWHIKVAGLATVTTWGLSQLG